MKIELVNVAGVPLKVLVVDSMSPYSACENCGKANYNHPELAKEDTDWCMTCNDEAHRKGWDETQMFHYVIEQMQLGKAVMVGSREEIHGWEKPEE